MEIFLYKKNLIENCEKNYKQTCSKQKIANVSSANECHKIDTSSRTRKTEHIRSRQNGVQTVKSHGIRKGYYVMYGKRIVGVLLRRTQLQVPSSNPGHIISKMNESNMFNMLLPGLRDLEFEGRISRPEAVKSKTFVCFLDNSSHFHYGFLFRNGSNWLVVCWENNEKTNKTVPAGECLIAFQELQTGNGREGVSREDFERVSWLDDAARTIIKEELQDFRSHKQKKLNSIFHRLAQLHICVLEEVERKIDELEE